MCNSAITELVQNILLHVTLLVLTKSKLFNEFIYIFFFFLHIFMFLLKQYRGKKDNESVCHILIIRVRGEINDEIVCES